jgi:hypothetical protein
VTEEVAERKGNLDGTSLLEGRCNPPEKVDEVGLLEEVAEDVCYLLVDFRVESLKEEEGGNIEGR